MTLKSKKLTALALLIIFVAITSYFISRPSKSSTLIPSSNTAKVAQSSGIISSGTLPKTPADQASNKVATGAQDSNQTLITPSGAFVSNHRPSLSGPQEQLSEQSVCNTNAGANCYIKFVQGSTVKSLEARTTDSTGTAYWSWNIKDSGLTEGTWTVTAVATLGGQTRTADDSIKLVVGP